MVPPTQFQNFSKNIQIELQGNKTKILIFADSAWLTDLTNFQFSIMKITPTKKIMTILNPGIQPIYKMLSYELAVFCQRGQFEAQSIPWYRKCPLGHPLKLNSSFFDDMHENRKWNNQIYVNQKWAWSYKFLWTL